MENGLSISTVFNFESGPFPSELLLYFGYLTMLQMNYVVF